MDARGSTDAINYRWHQVSLDLLDPLSGVHLKEVFTFSLNVVSSVSISINRTVIIVFFLVQEKKRQDILGVNIFLKNHMDKI